MKNVALPIVVIIVVIAILGGIAIGGNQQIENNESPKVNVNGKVETVGIETEPFSVDFVEVNSKKKYTITLGENGQYSTSLPAGIYQIKVHYSTISGLTTSECDGGTHNIDSDKGNLNIKC